MRNKANSYMFDMFVSIAALCQNDESLAAKGLLPGYQTYSTDQKQEVVNYAKETTVREASRKYNVPRSTVQVWCKHGPPVKKEKRSPGGGGRRLSYSNETDEKLLQWVLKQQDKGTPVTRDAIQAQARLLVRDECPEFKASSGWVEKFLARHNLTIATKMSSQNPSGECNNQFTAPSKCTASPDYTHVLRCLACFQCQKEWKSFFTIVCNIGTRNSSAICK